jgi:hypothetical protein
MRLPALTLAGLALLKVNTEHADPEAKRLLGVIGRKLHQGDRMPRYRVKAHTCRVIPYAPAYTTIMAVDGKR